MATEKKAKKTKREKPLTRRVTAPVLTTGSDGDRFILNLIKKADEVIRTGRPLKYDPLTLWAKFIEYVDWVVSNPAKVERPFSSGLIVVCSQDRPLKLIDFYAFAGITHSMFQRYEEKDDFKAITARVRDIIYSQKFDGAARGIFESNIIARDLGIGDKLDIAGTFDPSKPIKVEFGKGNTNVPKKSK